MSKSKIIKKGRWKLIDVLNEFNGIYTTLICIKEPLKILKFLGFNSKNYMFYGSEALGYYDVKTYRECPFVIYSMYSRYLSKVKGLDEYINTHWHDSVKLNEEKR